MQKLTIRELQELTSKWGSDRLITINGNVSTQTIKFGEEMSELFEAENQEQIKDAIGDMTVVISMIADLNKHMTAVESWLAFDLKIYDERLNPKDLLIVWYGKLCKTVVRNDIKKLDEIVAGIMTILNRRCDDYDISFTDCWNIAYNEIKDRKGKLLPNGNFVKEEDLKDV